VILVGSLNTAQDTAAQPTSSTKEDNRHILGVLSVRPPLKTFGTFLDALVKATDTWNEQLLSLEAWLSKKAYTHPSIRILILKGLKHWRSTETDYPPQPTQPELIYHQSTLEQFDIGWFNFLLGWIAKHCWALAQDAHYKSLGKRHTGQSWAKGLIVELWTFNWNIWEHQNTCKHTTEDTP